MGCPMSLEVPLDNLALAAGVVQSRGRKSDADGAYARRQGYRET